MNEFNASQDEIEVKLDVLGWADGEHTLADPDQRRPGARPGERQCAVGRRRWQGSTRLTPLNDLLSKEFLANFVPAGLEGSPSTAS